jgi:hypothetical protein
VVHAFEAPALALRLLLFTRQTKLLRHFGAVLRLLVDEGHDLVIAAPTTRSHTWLPRELRDHRRVRIDPYDEAPDPDLAASMRLLRLAGDYVHYLRPPADEAVFNRKRVLWWLANELGRESLEQAPDWWPEARAPLSQEYVARLLRVAADIESAVPPSPQLTAFIEERRPDAVLLTPYVSPGSAQVDAVKAARGLGIPTALLVFSWDNLSNKGRIRVPPDRVFVWNERQRLEAEELHDVDPERVVAVGAPRFDEFFAMTPSGPAEELHAALGLDPGGATVLYLGSSPQVVPDERVVVEGWLAAVRSAPDPELRRANVLIRPHPAQQAIWDEWRTHEPHVAVSRDSSKHGDQSLYDELWHSRVVVGLNTSAQIEAAIVGRPTCTFDAGGLAPGQEGSLHYRYLLEENGGPVLHATSLDEHVGQLARVLAGGVDGERLQSWVRSFVRPLGLDRPVAPLLAQAIVSFAREQGRPRSAWSRLRRAAR